MYFERAVRKTRPIPLVSLIDIMFFLLLFFMLTTSFVRNESLELTLPGNTPLKPGALQKVMQVYVTADGVMYLGQDQVSEKNLIEKLRAIFLDHPDMNVLLLSGPKVNVQQMITVMDRVYLAGGKNLSVESWEPKPLEQVTVTEPYSSKGVVSGN